MVSSLFPTDQPGPFGTLTVTTVIAWFYQLWVSSFAQANADAANVQRTSSSCTASVARAIGLLIGPGLVRFHPPLHRLRNSRLFSPGKLDKNKNNTQRTRIANPSCTRLSFAVLPSVLTSADSFSNLVGLPTSRPETDAVRQSRCHAQKQQKKNVLWGTWRPVLIAKSVKEPRVVVDPLLRRTPPGSMMSLPDCH
ncbi:hypothetical protein LZ31DRAFT_80249 [Colletotrichum somersetense]|nr:hypothetical protein LZ31DRAFT_80249 [Colletotrichum somersetense]